MTGDWLQTRNTHRAKAKECLLLSHLAPNIVPKINYSSTETKKPHQ